MIQTQIHTSTHARVRVSSFSTQTDIFFNFCKGPFKSRDGPLSLPSQRFLTSTASFPAGHNLNLRRTHHSGIDNPVEVFFSSLYCYVHVRILLYVSSYCYNDLNPRRAHHSRIHNPLVLILLHLCPHTTILIATNPLKKGVGPKAHPEHGDLLKNPKLAFSKSLFKVEKASFGFS